MLDLDQNGQLDYHEIVGVLQKRMLLGQGNKEDELKEAVKNNLGFVLSKVKEFTGM